MKKIKAAVLIAGLVLGLSACSKSSSNDKETFFTELENIVKIAENNANEERVPQLKADYDAFIKKYPKITKSSGWTAEDTEKMEDLQKRFDLSTTPISQDDSNLWTNIDSSDMDYTNDLGLDDELKFGNDADLSGLDLSGLDFGGVLSVPSTTSSTEDASWGGLTLPDFSQFMEDMATTE